MDRQRQAPQLRVTRQQFPVAPGFAVTAHIAQGQTLREGVIADFNIGDAGNPFTTYVAATRVTGRDKLLLLRPFPAGPFQKGIGIGRGLLLQVLRGDAVNWEALRAKYTEERLCCDCNESKNKNAFTVGQWKREDAAHVCRECVSRHASSGSQRMAFHPTSVTGNAVCTVSASPVKYETVCPLQTTQSGRRLRAVRVENTGSESAHLPGMRDKGPRVLDLQGLPPGAPERTV